MNLQSLMKQAQAMQKNMLDTKGKIDVMTFVGKSELVEVKMNGKREVISVEIKNKENFELDDLEILEDMISIALNDALKQIEKEISQKLGNQTAGLSGLF